MRKRCLLAAFAVLVSTLLSVTGALARDPAGRFGGSSPGASAYGDQAAGNSAGTGAAGTGTAGANSTSANAGTSNATTANAANTDATSDNAAGTDTTTANGSTTTATTDAGDAGPPGGSATASTTSAGPGAASTASGASPRVAGPGGGQATGTPPNQGQRGTPGASSNASQTATSQTATSQTATTQTATSQTPTSNQPAKRLIVTLSTATSIGQSSSAADDAGTEATTQTLQSLTVSPQSSDDLTNPGGQRGVSNSSSSTESAVSHVVTGSSGSNNLESSSVSSLGGQRGTSNTSGTGEGVSELIAGANPLTPTSPVTPASSGTSSSPSLPQSLTSPSSIPAEPTTGSPSPPTSISTAGTGGSTPASPGISVPGLAGSPLAQLESTILSGATPGGGGAAPAALLPGGALALAGAPGGAAGAGAGALAAAGLPLAAAATPLAALLAPAAAGASKPQGGGHKPASKPTAHVQHPATVTKIINSVERVIPGYVWIAIAVSLGLAAIGGASALRSSRIARRQAGAFAAVSAAALTDPLTGVLNRRGFNDAVERELARSRRYSHPFVLAYVDVRGLKQVNDTAGHLAGDRLLKEVALILTHSARESDVVGRLGGDELGVLLAEQSPAGAAAVTERIRTQVPISRAKLNLRAPWDLTIGIAAFPRDGDSFEELLHVADRRLYEQRGIALPGQEPQPPASAPLS